MAYYSNPRFVRAANQGVGLVRNFTEASSQTFKAGQLVYLNGAGNALTACASDATSILGIARADATNVTSGHASIPVEIIRPGDEIEIDVYQGGSTKAATTAMLLKNFALDVSSNSCKIDLNDTGHDCMTLQEIVNPDGTTVIVTFLPSVLQYNTGY